jgi:regulator of protease activity HflC (stomatin/prohibitin superfamily)
MEDKFFDMIEAKVLNRRVTDAYREEAGEYKTSDELMNNKKKFEKRVEDRLKIEFAKKHFDLTTLSSGLTPPQSMIDAIEARNVAIQEANRVENQLNTARKLQAKALIDSKTNEIIAAGLDDKILTARWIDALRYTSNKVIITDGRTPVFIGK